MTVGRKTGGRQKGSLNKSTREQQAAAIASGLAPLDYMLAVMRDAQQPPERRDDMAKAAAPYVHPRLSSAELNIQRKTVREKTDAELDEILAGIDRSSAGEKSPPLDPSQLN